MEKRILWLLDHGHGQRQPGKRSPKFKDGSRFEEWRFNRTVVQHIESLACTAGLNVQVISPDAEFCGADIEERAETANEAAEAHEGLSFGISVHSNAAPMEPGRGGWNYHAEGIETWTRHEDDLSKMIGLKFQRELVKMLKFKDRGIKSRPLQQFYLLQHCTMPLIFTETGFYTHPKQVRELLKPEVQYRVALAHLYAMLEIERYYAAPEWWAEMTSTNRRPL